jgi:ABC-type oligopeptide transport system ATPase subunit
MKLLGVGGYSLYPTIGIFGMSGSGKTSLAATAGKLLIADSNEGTMAIDHVPAFAEIKRVRVKKMLDLDNIYDNMTGTGQQNWRKKFDVVSLDHFDEIQSIILDNLAEKASDTREEPDQIELREYGIMANKLRRYLRKMKAIPKVKILIMGEKYYEREDWMYPALVGQMKDQLPYFLDHCIYLRVSDKGVRYLHLDPKPGEFYAKTRARWFTKEERKIRFDLDNYTLLADLIEKVRRGPGGDRKKKRKE